MAQGGEMVTWYLCWIGRSFVPNFQALILTDALTQGHSIPVSYIADTTLYGVLVILVALSLARS